MNDLTKKSGILYLSLFLLLICSAAGAVMAIVAQMTDKPIRERQKKIIEKTLTQVLPPFDTLEQKTVLSPDNVESVFFAVKKDGVIAGYAVQTSTLFGYGGEIRALVGFTPEKKIYRIVVISHNETPGIGTKVVSRQKVQKISSFFSPEEATSPNIIPPNAALDSYNDLKAKHFISAEPNTDIVTSATVHHDSKKDVNMREKVHFVTGATVSSNAIFDLVSRACEVVQSNTKEVK